MKKRYVQVGVGGRARFFYQAVVGTYSETSELVGFCDLNQTRMDYANSILKKEYGANPVPTYPVEKFEDMIRNQPELFCDIRVISQDVLCSAIKSTHRIFHTIISTRIWVKLIITKIFSLANMSDVKQSTLDNIMRGMTKNHRVKTLHKIALAFNMTLAEFLDFDVLNEYSFETDEDDEWP